MFDKVVGEVKCDKVLVDDEDLVFRATKTFISSGRKQLALAATISNVSIGKKRIKGYNVL